MKRGAAIALLLALLASSAGADDAYDEGKALFERKWESAADGGLGPLFNAKSCNGCHKDGGPSRVFKVGTEWIARGAVVRIGTKGGAPDSRFGRQVQDLAIAGLTPEAALHFDFTNHPAVQIDFNNGPADPASVTELRLAPSLLGRNMLDAVSAAAITALADPLDTNGDGISGRARMLFGGAIGRFGHKANTPTIAQQSAEAAAIDLGLATTRVPLPHGDCTALQDNCVSQAATDAPELADEDLALIANFVATLKAPNQPADAFAEKLFTETGCAFCHTPALSDAQGRMLPVYTDLLLHDMGEALSGAIGGDGVSPAEWRTAPLIDLDPRDGLRRYLHDGRAKTIEEAVEAHGGEGAEAARRFQSLAGAQRAGLVTWLQAR